jgi:hypothetical protein
MRSIKKSTNENGKDKNAFLTAVSVYRIKGHKHNEDKLKFWSPE